VTGPGYQARWVFFPFLSTTGQANFAYRSDRLEEPRVVALRAGIKPGQPKRRWAMRNTISSYVRAGRLVLALAFMLGLAPRVLAGPPENETITDLVFFDPNGGTTTTWSSSGEFADSGAVTAYPVFEFHGNAHLVHAVHTNDFGTFTISAVADLATHEGHWVITEGTGVYAGIHGSGSLTVTFVDENTVRVEHTGRVLFK